MPTQEYSQALEKLKSYCAYQERCEFEVVKKIEGFNLDSSYTQKIVLELKQFNYLDNRRFADAYCSGKFKMKGWGKRKIYTELKARYVPGEIISSALNTIDDDEYKSKLIEIANKKWKLLNQNTDMKTRHRLSRFLYGKGYEAELINDFLGSLNQ